MCGECKPVNKELIDKDFYEAFWYSGKPDIFDGKVVEKRDSASGYPKSSGDCKVGVFTNKKTAIWYGVLLTEADGCPKGFLRDAVSKACTRTEAPPDWHYKVPSTTTIHYGFKASWNCCPDSEGTTVLESL